MKKRSALIALSGALIGSALSSMVALAWTGPTGTAPSNNVSAPINVGTTTQVKNGGLSVNALSVFGSGYVQTKLGIGTVSPVVPLQVVGNAYLTRLLTGTSQSTNVDQGFYDFGAVHIAALTSIYSYGKICAGNGIGDCSGGGGTTIQSNGIIFPDGTVQTTAATAGGGGGISAATYASTWFLSGSVTASCPAGYFRTGCSATSATYARIGGGTTDPSPTEAVPSGTNACSCTANTPSGSGGTVVAPVCYVYCAK